MATYEFSSSFMQGVASVLKVKHWEELAPLLDPDVKAMVDSPRRERWWPGSAYARLMIALDQRFGELAVERVSAAAVEGSVAPIAMPLIKVTFALSGPSPATILSRASAFGSTAMRGVDLKYHAATPCSGELVAAYPELVPAGPYAASWRGTLKFVIQLTGVQGTLGKVGVEGDGKVLRMPISWR